MVLYFFFQVPLPEIRPCLCELCPDDADKDKESCCCLYEYKIVNACREEGVQCVARLTKMCKIKDKVK